MTTHKSALAARVAAVNNANAYALELYDKLVPIFTPLVGQRVLKQGGSPLAKVKKLLPEFPNTNALHVYKYSSPYSLVFVVKTYESYENGCVYHEASVRIGGLDGLTLTSINDEPPAYRTDFKVKDVLALREAYNKAKAAADAARDKLWPFGEYDR